MNARARRAYVLVPRPSNHDKLDFAHHVVELELLASGEEFDEVVELGLISQAAEYDAFGQREIAGVMFVIRRLAAELWGDGMSPGEAVVVRRVGEGRIVSLRDLAKEIDSQKTEITQSMQQHLEVTPKIVDVNDMGDAAFLVEMDGSLQLHAFAKGAVIVASRNVSATPENLAQLEKFSRAARSHLP